MHTVKNKYIKKNVFYACFEQMKMNVKHDYILMTSKKRVQMMNCLLIRKECFLFCDWLENMFLLSDWLQLMIDEIQFPVSCDHIFFTGLKIT